MFAVTVDKDVHTLSSLWGDWEIDSEVDFRVNKNSVSVLSRRDHFSVCAVGQKCSLGRGVTVVHFCCLVIPVLFAFTSSIRGYSQTYIH